MPPATPPVGILNKFRDEFEYFIEQQALAPTTETWNASRSSSTASRSRPSRGQTVHAGGACERHRHPVLLLAPAAVDRRQLPHLRRSQIEGRSWVEIACNMPVSEGHARAHRFRPGAGVPQGDHAAHDAQPSGRLRHLRQGGRVHAAGLPLPVQRRAVGVARRQGARRPSSTPLSERIVLDNERCILCSRCVRFTREISKSNALGIVQRGDASLVRAAEDRPLDADPYSDNVIDICPVGALLSRSFLLQGARLVSASRRRRSARAARAAARSTSGTARPSGS